jgi:hypothetical protein
VEEARDLAKGVRNVESELDAGHVGWVSDGRKRMNKRWRGLGDGE